MMQKQTPKIIVTSGPTREFIDPIRYLSNPSTGKMGHSIARAGIEKKYRVVFISGPVPKPYAKVTGAKNIDIVSNQDMLNAVLKELCSQCILIMAAAPADFKPEKSFPKKLKKSETHTIQLVHNADILKEVSKQIEKKGLKQIGLIGFAAETHKARVYALKKLREKKLDIIFLNDLSRKDSGFGTSTNQLTLFRRDDTSEKWPTHSKEELGHKIIKEVEKLINSRKSGIPLL